MRALSGIGICAVKLGEIGSGTSTVLAAGSSRPDARRGVAWGFLPRMLLMGLLFVGGLINLLWSAGLALLVLIEKLFPLGPRVAQLTGVALIGWGAFVLVH